MANLETFKDVRTVASISALVAVGISSSYFYNEITEVKKEQEEIKKHLATIIPLVDPNTMVRINSAIKSIEILDSRLAKAQDDIKIISNNAKSVAQTEPPKRTYQRLINKQDHYTSQEPEFVTHQITVESDVDEDVAVMLQ